MKYRELHREDNDACAERNVLVRERILTILTEESVRLPFRDYFAAMAHFILLTEDVFEKAQSGWFLSAGEEELQALNGRLYGDILPENYDNGFFSPVFAVSKFGAEEGKILSMLASELRDLIPWAMEERHMDMTALEELFVEVYNLYERPEEELPAAARAKALHDAIYYYEFDYCDRLLPARIRESLSPEADFGASLIREADLTDLRYLYRFGEYISESELRTAAFLNSLPEETVKGMADTFTEGFRRAFEVSGRSFAKKSTVQIRYHLGFERMMRYAAENFEKMGLTAVFPRIAWESMNRTVSRAGGYCGEPANRQYEYDHRYDNSVYLDKGFKERKLTVLRTAYEDFKDAAGAYAGPAVMETFGEKAFSPENRKEAAELTEKQEKLSLEYSSEARQVINRYIPEEETSFTIIAFPLPEIGEDFECIFQETIRINTLDNGRWSAIQQKIIEALDGGDWAEIRGRGGNRTNLKVALAPLSDGAAQTRFENCTADMNIPVGEVFTSPVLQGTDGLLHVQQVYINGYQFKDLEIRFENGRTVSGTCANFEREEENRKLVKQVIFANHDSLPMGEFAVGTNTTAYAAALRYGIQDKFPILIAEKTGPHFAVGDTCYSWMEDVPVHNPDGREMIAKENEISRCRKTDPGKAYFNCHTDITIPYSELDTVEAVSDNGTRTAIIAGGRFVLPGTEELNAPLLALEAEGIKG